MKKVFAVFLLFALFSGCASVNVPRKSFYVKTIVEYNNTKTLTTATDISYSVDYNLEKNEKLDTVAFNIKTDLYAYKFIFLANDDFRNIVSRFIVAERKSVGTAHINIGSLVPLFVYITDLNGKTFRGFSTDKFNFNFYNDTNSKQFIINDFTVMNFNNSDIIYTLDSIPIEAAVINKISDFIQTDNIKKMRNDKIKEESATKANKKKKKKEPIKKALNSTQK
ncbi:hypothetical protein H0R92_07745 [Treponema sp. OMZ 840]|uniref:hypothetical protein n=1 Tax=Treponema sp. OMZ 840 TaxID=244313 RepID=UPI003D8BA3F0